MIAIPQMTNEELSRATPRDEAGFGSLATARGHLPLRAMRVEARIVGLTSEVTLVQTFSNAFDEPIEATYIFPLPDRAGVTRFRMEVDGRVIEGEMKERGDARRAYSDAIASGHRAAITEEERPGVFTMRVGNLMPREDAKVTLVLTGALPFDDGEATFRFPLVVAPRYIPGRPLPGENVGDGVAADTDLVPDASRISPPVLLPGHPNPVQLALEVELDPAGHTFSNLRSSLHAVVDNTSGARQRLSLRPGARLDRDFVLRFGVGGESLATALALCPDGAGTEGTDGREGTFLLTLVPPTGLARAERPKDVVFVLDRSGSMGGWKMLAARRAASRMIDTLTARDRFQIYAFDDRVESPDAFAGPALVSATDRNRFRAVEFLAKLGARGGTELAAPLELAADQLGRGEVDRDRVLVLVTDGQVGNEDHILRRLQARLQSTRVFTLGIDRAVNEAFLKRLAALGGGLSELVESEDRLDEVMDKIHRRIATPLLRELELVPTGLEVIADSVTPGRLPDVFAGAPVTIMGRYRGPARGALQLRGKTSIGKPWVLDVTGGEAEDRAVRTLWARAAVRELEDRFVVGRGDPRVLEQSIVALSLKHSVLSRFTAFLAVDRAARPNPGGRPHAVMQPVELPDGWDPASALGGAPMAGAPGSAPRGVAPAPVAQARPVSVSVSMSFSADMGTEEASSPAPASVAPSRPQSMAKRVLAAFAPTRPSAPPATASSPPPPPAAAPSPAPERGSSAKSSMVRAERGRAATSGGAETTLEADALSAYRGRARALLDRLREDLARDGSVAGRTRALEGLTARLVELVEDLTSVAGHGAARPLAELLEALRLGLSRDRIEADEASALERRAEVALEAFAGTPPSADPAPSRRTEFWK